MYPGFGPAARLSNRETIRPTAKNMEELLLAVLGAIAETLFELFLEFVLGAIIAFFSRATRKLFGGLIDLGAIPATIAFALLGAALGEFSVIVFPHPLFHPSSFHGISLLVSPLATGFVMSLVGRHRRRRGRDTVRIESFGYGYIFALTMALVRFLVVR